MEDTQLKNKSQTKQTCLVITLLLGSPLCLVCLFLGKPQLVYNWVLWEVEDVDDYQITFSRSGASENEHGILTVCDEVVVKAECDVFPYRLNDEPYCPFENNPNAYEWMQRGYSLEDMQEFTIDNLYESIFIGTLFCNVDSFNWDYHYPIEFGCGFIEGYVAQVSEFAEVDCSDYSN